MAMRYWSHSTWALVLPLIVWGAHVEAHPWQVSARTTTNSSAPQLQTSYAQLPLYFEANQGQANNQVKFLAQGSGYALALTANEAVLALAQPGRSGEMAKRGNGQEPQPLAPNVQSSMVRMQLVGANASPIITGLAELPGKTNYFVGKDASQWRTNIPTYAKVKYEQVYSGIDLVYYGNKQQLEYDFILQPGVDPKVIRLAFGGVSGQVPLRIEDAGDLALSTAAGDVRFHRPHIYQEIDGIKKEIAGRYVMMESEEEEGTSLQSPASSPQIGFAVAAYDTTKPLIIDPVLSYSTYLGGVSGSDIAVDASGSIYVTGVAVQDFLSTSNVFQPQLQGASDAFVAKLDPTGASLIYATYVGGSAVESDAHLAVDSAGNVYIAGVTTSSDFSTTATAYQRTCAGSEEESEPCRDVFVAKLDMTGSALLFATYLGGPASEAPSGLALDDSGNVYVTGFTRSPTFPTTPGAFREHCVLGNESFGSPDFCSDSFVTKLNANGSALFYSTYLGGNQGSAATDLAVDATGNAYVTGTTTSTNFPTTLNTIQPACYGGRDASCVDAFILKLNATGSARVYGTYLGGSGGDYGNAIALDAAGNVYVTGYSQSDDFPTKSALRPQRCSECNAFVSKLNPTATQLIFSTYLQSGGSEIALDGAANVYITGSAFSGSTDRACRGGLGGLPIFCSLSTIVLTKLAATGSSELYSFLLGGSRMKDSRSDIANAIAVDSAGNVYVTGRTNSMDFPTTPGVYQPFPNGSSSPGFNGFITKIIDQQPGIRGYLEYPDNGPVAGLGVIHGWAFATETGMRISRVDLFIDGQRIKDIPGILLDEIPCCSERQDVRDAFPQFSADNTLNSGWGITFNWNLLDAGNHSVRVKVTSTIGEIFLTDTRTVSMVKPADSEFLDRFALSQATAAIQNQDLVVNSVMVRDKATQQQKTIDTRFRWFTSTQSLGLVQAETVGMSSTQRVAPPFSAWFASLASRIPGWPLLVSAQATAALVPYFEDPTPEEIVSGIRIIRGWAFSEEATARISAIRLTTDMDSQGTIPCCSGRGDVAAAFSGQPNALNSGWGATFNYGNLSAGPHTIGVQIEDSTGAAVSPAHNVTVVRLGGYAFVDQFDLFSATARLDGEEIVLNGVVVRDKASQQTKTIAVRLRWSQSSQGLEIVAATE